MNDDVSDIPLTGCSVITGNNTLSNYNSNVRKDFIFNGGKWYLYRTQTNYNNYDISSYNCINPTTISSYAIYKPLFYGVAFILFCVAVFCFFKIIGGLLHAK